MRPGLSADDIYIMVEDEFHAVAQTFTKHLHHAEYIRLRKAAKDRSASTINNISRPVDSTTTMREETRRKKEVEARELKMKAAVESIKGPKRAKRPLDESDISDFEEDRQDDPWQGTQLQRFMTKSPKKTLTGLTGLQGVTSHTRAAAGYSKPEKRLLQPTRPFESARSNASAAKTVTVAQAVSDSSSDTDDDDDLDAPSRIPSRPPSHVSSQPPATATKPHPVPQIQNPTNRVPKANPPSAKPPQRPSLDKTKRTAPTPMPPASNPSRTPIPPDPSPPPLRHEPITESRPSVSEVRQRLKARREREENAKRKKVGGGIGGVDEIPIFLV